MYHADEGEKTCITCIDEYFYSQITQIAQIFRYSPRFKWLYHKHARVRILVARTEDFVFIEALKSSALPIRAQLYGGPEEKQITQIIIHR